MIDGLKYESSLDALRKYIEAENFKGYDPYDGLNSPLLSFLSFRQKYLRIGWIQFMKHFPINLRPFLGVPKGYNPKGLGLFLWGYARLYKITGQTEYKQKVQHFINLLKECKSKGYNGNAWGYNFDWQSRVFFVPKHTPTVVNSSFIGHALLDAFQYAGIKEALELALPIKDFLVNDLHRTQDSDTICFSYTPIDKTIVHNANLLGASLIARLNRYSLDEEALQLANKALNYSMKYQRPDGSWYYAETEIQDWIDSFHTGFNLQCIRYFLKEGLATEHREGYEKGVAFYANNFFLEDGTPKYYHDKTYPIDIHSPAQALVFFSEEGDRYRVLSNRILEWMVSNMQSPNGYFYFQKKKGHTNKTPYMRWGQSWAFHGLTAYHLNAHFQKEKQTSQKV